LKELKIYWRKNIATSILYVFKIFEIFPSNSFNTIHYLVGEEEETAGSFANNITIYLRDPILNCVLGL